MEHDQKPYNFMKEVIKEKKLDKKAIVLRIVFFVGAAVLFGLIASVVFVLNEPYANLVIHGKEEPPKVDIPVDEQPTPTPEAESAASGSSGDTASSDTSLEGAQENENIGLVEYRQLYKDMLAVAEKPKRAMVTVIGITNQMDYFLSLIHI